MAVRIQGYEQRTSPSGAGPTPVAHGQTVDMGIARGLGQVAGALDDVAALQGQRLKQAEMEKQKQEAEDAKVYAGTAISKARDDMLTHFTELQNTADPGAPEFTKKFNDDFSKYETELLANAPNETSRTFLKERMVALRDSMSGQAITYEVGERRRYNVDQRQQAIDTTASTLARDPTNFSQVMAEQKAINDALEIPPAEKAALNDKLNATVATSVTLAMAKRDPVMTRAYLADRIGVDVAEIAGPAKTAPNAQEVQGKYEAIAGAMGFTTTSTTRTPEENAKVGGVPNSQHLVGTARDYSIKGKTPQEVEAFVLALREEGFEASVHTKGTAPHVHSELPPDKVRGPTVAEAMTKKPDGQKTGNPAIDLLTVPQVISLLGTVDAEIGRQQSEFRSLIATREADDLAAYGDGKQPPQPITAGEFMQAYGGVEGTRRYQAYQGAARFASNVNGLALKSNADIQATLAASAPKPGPGYATASKQYDALVQAAQAVVKARNEDPMAFAAARGVAPIEPLNLADQAQMREQLRARVGVADTMSRQYGTAYTLVTNAEKDQLVEKMAGWTAPEKGQFLASVRQALPDNAAYHSLMAQLRPDSPVTATAGSLYALGDAKVTVGSGGFFGTAPTMTAAQVAQKLLIGEDLLNPTKDAKGQDGKPKLPMPQDSDLRAAWSEYTGGAYAGAPETEQANYQAFRAFYAAEAAAKGQFDGQFDPKIAQRAAQAVTGGVIDVGKSQVLLPYGVDEATTLDALEREWAKARDAAGLPASIDLDKLSLQTVGDGQYMISAGTGPVRDRNNQVIILRVSRAATSVPGQRMRAGL